MKYLATLFPLVLLVLSGCSAAAPDEARGSNGASDGVAPAADVGAANGSVKTDAVTGEASGAEEHPELYTKCGVYSCAPGWVCSDGACCKGAAMCCANAGGVWVDGHCG